MSSAQLLFLDSNNATQIGETPSDLIFSLNFNTGNNMSNYALSIQSVTFPNAVYPITDDNNKVYFKEDGGGTLTATLSNQNYTGSQFAIELATQLDAESLASGLGRTYTVSFNSNTDKLTISAGDLPNTIQFVSGLNDVNLEAGFDPNQSALNQYVGAYPINLSGSAYVDVQADISTQNYSSNGKSNILERIPIDSNYGSIIIYQNTTDDYIRLNESSISTIEIRLLNDKGALYELPKNANVSFVIKLSQILLGD